MLNQKDDGLVKLPGNPLSIEAAGDNTSQKKAINFYQNFADANPTWSLSLNPRSDPSNANTARPGLSISDGAGNSRLFIDQETGNVGIGKLAPAELLHLASTGSAKILLEADTGNLDENESAHPQLVFTQDGGKVSGYVGFSGNHLRLANTWDNVSAYIGFMTRSRTRMTITGDGDVGIGTTDPGGAKLKIANAANDFAYFQLGSGMGPLEIGGWENGWNIQTKTDSKHLYLNRDAGEKSNVLIGRLGKELFVRGSDGNVGIGTTDPGPSKLKIANSATDFANFLFAPNQSGMGELRIVGWNEGWNINAQTDGKHLYLNRDSGGKSNVLIGRNGKELFVRGSDGNVGIGTTDPQDKLQVDGYTSLGIGIANSHFPYRGNNWAYVSGKGIIFRDDKAGGYAERMRIADNGYVGIGTTAPKAPLHVATRSGRIGGASFRSGAGNTQYWSIGCFEWIGAQGLRSWSDARVKMHPSKLNTTEALAAISTLKLVDYTHIPEYQGGKKGRGVYAQELQKLCPEAVSSFPEMVLEDGRVIKDFLSVDYNWLFVTGLAAIQELKKHNEQLRDDVKQLQQELEAQTASLA